MGKIIAIICNALLIYTTTFSQPPQWRRASGTTGIWTTDIDIYAGNPDTLFAFGDKFLRSVDRGEHWDTLPGPPGPRLFFSGALKVDAFNSNIVYTSYSLDVPSDHGENEVAVTKDGGQHWETLFVYPGLDASVVEIDPVDQRVVYVGVGSGEIKRTSDQGQTWQDLTPFEAAGLKSLGIASTNDSVLYAGSYYALAKSTDQGNTWTQLPFTDTAPKFVVDPRDANVVYAAEATFGGPGGIFKSLDGGMTWIEKNSGFIADDNNHMEDIIINPNNPNELFVAKGSHWNKFVFRTSDGGETWSDFSSGIPDSGGRATSIALDARNNRMYVGSTHGIYILDSLTSVDSVETIVVRSPGWNLISVPVARSDNSISSVFPSALSGTTFEYADRYVARDTLMPGKGYWTKFPTTFVKCITGTHIDSMTVEVNQGWNIIGAISSPVPVSTITSDPGGIRTSNFFGYAEAYQTVDTIAAGRGYWVKVNQSGKLILSSSASMAQKNRIRIVETFELPPVPPEGNGSNLVPLTSGQIPTQYALEQNYPNPFNPTTFIRYQLPSSTYVTLKIYDVLGREIITLVEDQESPGSYTVPWNAGGYASGVYFYRLTAGTIAKSGKMIVAK